MKARHAVLAALVAAVTLASVAAAGPDATKQRVAITTTVLPAGKAALTPLQEGRLQDDSGTFGGDWSRTPNRVVIRDGQEVSIHTGTWTFTGKLGKLVFRERNEWVDVAYGKSVAIGTWKVVRGTGQYAGIVGGGRSGHAGGFGGKWVAQYEGLLTVP